MPSLSLSSRWSIRIGTDLRNCDNVIASVRTLFSPGAWAMHDSQEPIEERKKPHRRRRTIIFLIVSLVNAGVLTVIVIALLVPARNAGQTNDPLIGHAAPNFSLAALNPGQSGNIS